MLTTVTSEPPDSSSYFERLLHRWFVQYNPLYLMSAVCVLVGVTLVNRGLAGDTSLWGSLAGGAISEVYAFALIAGASVLVRIDLPRPAVFVALIAVLYQGDVALGTETHALFGAVGRAASLVWLVAFVAKLRALAWALRLELSWSAWMVPSFGALGLATIPHLSRALSSHALTMVVGLWVFGVATAALWTTRRVMPTRALDAWGRTVLRRALLATWTIWAALAVAHALFWTSHYHLDHGVFLPVCALVTTRWVRREWAVLATVSWAGVFVALSTPELFQTAALMSAVVFSLHALRKPFHPEPGGQPAARDHYPGAAVDHAAEPVPAFAPSPRAALARQLAWAGYAVYLALWTFSWSGGALPAHILPLDVVASAAAVLYVWRTDARVAVLPLFATYLHAAVVARVVRAPQSTLQWGVATVAIGFGLLFAGVLASWRFGREDRLRRVG